MPRGQEHRARAFFVGMLGMKEMPKPQKLAQRGGAWFSSGSVQLHLGVEENFIPAKKAHPALLCTEYEQLIKRLEDANIKIRESNEIPNQRRAFIEDPFGNRIELVAR